MKLSYYRHILQFKFAAGTSRGVYREKPTWIIKLQDGSNLGYGECGPLKGLSIDLTDQMDEELERIKEELSIVSPPKDEKEALQLAYRLTGYRFPSIRFGLETAFLDLLNGGSRIIFNNDFIRASLKIPINGLIWMGDLSYMREQAISKPGKGFGCLKMKIGALNFHEELEIIKEVRTRNQDIILRLDANGAFTFEEAIETFNEVKIYGIHSVEQPIAPGHIKQMKQLCKESPLAIALDEELIGINTTEDKLDLLSYIRPQYIILKPSLVGGIASCNEWIAIAKQLKIGWWITSALESNIGLNAIAQYTAEVRAESFQGLGTGQLYENNFISPLTVDKGFIYYDQNRKWEINL